MRVLVMTTILLSLLLPSLLNKARVAVVATAVTTATVYGTSTCGPKPAATCHAPSFSPRSLFATT
eukprot:1499451-Alexandrium_andersonii.AAC.1